MPVKISIAGLTEAHRKFAHLRGTAAGNEMEEVLLSAAKIIASEAERLAPLGPTGNLKRSFRAAKSRVAKTFLQAFAFTLRPLAPHAHLVEFGTKPHTIMPKKAGALWFGKYPVRKVEHPGARPVVFFRDAVRNKRSEVRREIEKALKRMVDSAAR